MKRIHGFLSLRPWSAYLPPLILILLGAMPVRAEDSAAGKSPGSLLAKQIPAPSVPTGTWTRQRIAVATFSEAPVLDGRIEEECWRNATRASGFYRFGSSAPVTEQTEAWIGTDQRYLYIAFHCLDSKPELIRTNETQRGGDLDNDDHITILLDSQNTRRQASIFAVSANGTQTEELEGGTAGNITWAGDWKAAAVRTADGWTCEVAIPFRLLRYPRGATAFGILLLRRLARETNPECWPYLPPEGQSWENRIQYLNDFHGLNPPFFAPRPTILPYLLATAGDGSLARQGLDVKYPLSTTLTGLLTVNPDFRTIEQEVTGINFSYNERFVEDRRPFFAEGAEFLPAPELFYSRRIDTLDEGIKIAGKNGVNTVGLVMSARQQAGKERTSYALNLGRDVGPLSRFGFSAAGDNRETASSNRVGRIYGTYGWRQGRNRFSVEGNAAQSWVAGAARGRSENVHFRLHGMPGIPGFRVSYNTIASDFISDLGFVPERNRRGWSASAFQFNNFDRGPIEFYEANTAIELYRRRDGGFFRRSFYVGSYLQTRRGYGIELGGSRDHRQQDLESYYQDYDMQTGFWWNQRTQFQGGGFSIGRGKAAGEPSRFLQVQQDFLLRRPLTVRLEASQQILGSETTSQTIVTGTYRLDSARTISGRLLRQDGKNTNPAQTIGVLKGTNLYLAYSQRVRSGNDIFILLGDPNRAGTRSQVTVKLLRPY
ncbi:MAG: carbohydrate binding family 9 domain-containing protein [Capsulimonadales bacterium]|nr:carbohydrate binding family 9 domain-containing protein [Capsulimonadales bacterium]